MSVGKCHGYTTTIVFTTTKATATTATATTATALATIYITITTHTSTVITVDLALISAIGINVDVEVDVVTGDKGDVFLAVAEFLPGATIHYLRKHTFDEESQCSCGHFSS